MAPIEVSSNNTMIFPEVASLADPRTPSRAEIERQVASHWPNHHSGICSTCDVYATMLRADALRTAPIWDSVSTPKFNMLPPPGASSPRTDRNSQPANDRVNHLYVELPSSDVEDGMDPRFPSPIPPRKGTNTPYPMPLLAERRPPPLPPMSPSREQEQDDTLRNGRGSPFPFRDSSSKKHVHISFADTLIPPSPVNATNIPLPMSPINGSSTFPSSPDTLNRLTGTTLSAGSSYANSNGNIPYSHATLPPSYSAHSADPCIQRPALPLSNPVPAYPGGSSVLGTPSIPSSTKPLLRTPQEQPRRQTPKLSCVPSYPALSTHGVWNEHPVHELHRLSSVKGKDKDKYDDTVPGSPSINSPTEPRVFDTQANSLSREQVTQSQSVTMPHSGGVERSANSSQISLGSRGSRFNERFDLDGAIVLAAGDRTRELRAQRKKRIGVMVGDEEVVDVTEKGPEGGDEREEENDRNGCTGIKGVKGIKKFKRKVKEWREMVQAKEWRDKVCAEVRKVLGKAPKEGMARNF